MTCIKTFSAPTRFDLRGFFADIWRGIKLSEVWGTFAWDEIQKRYRRSKLGLAWIAISFVLFVIAISFFFGGFSSASGNQFIAHVATGYAAFLFIISSLMDGCDVFGSSTTWIKSTALPHSLYVYKSIARSLFVFVLNMLVALAILLFTGWRPTLYAFYVVPVIIVFLLNSVWVQLLLGYLCSKFPDAKHLVTSLVRLLFFITPILWVLSERGGTVRVVADFNPLTHYVEIFRQPLLGNPPPVESWLFVGIFTLTGILVCTVIGSFYRNKLPFWL